jgi:predicted S18 family serine protease
MIDVIPIQYRILAVFAAFMAVSLISGFAGAEIATWRADAAHAAENIQHLRDVAKLNETITSQNEAIAKANQAVAVAKAQSDAADLARAEAERHAADLAAFSKSRVERLEAYLSTATNCTDVLSKYWEERK